MRISKRFTKAFVLWLFKIHKGLQFFAETLLELLLEYLLGSVSRDFRD